MRACADAKFARITLTNTLHADQPKFARQASRLNQEVFFLRRPPRPRPRPEPLPLEESRLPLRPLRAADFRVERAAIFASTTTEIVSDHEGTLREDRLRPADFFSSTPSSSLKSWSSDTSSVSDSESSSWASSVWLSVAVDSLSLEPLR